VGCCPASGVPIGSYTDISKKYSHMKLEMKWEALEKINRQTNEVKGVDRV
jgi:hypothetical protein